MAILYITLASQIDIGLLLTDFRVSLGIVMLTILIYKDKSLNSPFLGVVSGVSIYFWRIILYSMANGKYGDVILAYFPEIFFYTFYGMFFWILIRKKNIENLNKLFLVTFTSDFVGNIIEVIIRTENNLGNFNIKIIEVLILAAFIRSSIIWLILNAFKHYKILLMKERHEKRYRNLLLLTSQLKTEAYWMERNMDYIEKVMGNAYGLFEKIQTNKERESWAETSINIARDIHEIKKEYKMVVHGVTEITDDKFKDKGMRFKDIIKILEDSMKIQLSHEKSNIQLNFNLEKDFYTDKHYCLMSIFRNIIMNGIDAIKEKNNNGIITFNHNIIKDRHVFKIADNGCGIEENKRDLIFSSGFSTKINYDTGEINRGLGLSLVKNLVDNKLRGTINLKSKVGAGTTFIISIPKEFLEGN
ncbi:sensor histidine kinase [Dethiothermospora halolimnae]|uniref:sensor histidine kinase n=1 Tax=Dethiothermospora halolimnae TaxID=3114390 RepID=UPI003CCBEF77